MKSVMAEGEYDALMETLFRYMRLVPAEMIEEKWVEARQVMGHIDEEDVVFVAAALSLPDSLILSDDRDFERQNKVVVVKTKELV